MHDAILLILTTLIAVGIIAIGCFYLVSPADFVGGQEPNLSNFTSHRSVESAPGKYVETFAAKLQSYCKQ
jgi:hypothetical protein